MSFVLYLFIILVVALLGFKGRTLVLIAFVLGHCLLFNLDIR